MPQRIPQHTIVLVRDGQRVKPVIGKPFNFTPEEVKSITASNPKALRHPINESTDAVAEFKEIPAAAAAPVAPVAKVIPEATITAAVKTPTGTPEATVAAAKPTPTPETAATPAVPVVKDEEL